MAIFIALCSCCSTKVCFNARDGAYCSYLVGHNIEVVDIGVRLITFKLMLKKFFWTDSQVILGYIRNELKRFKVFVANRVQNIRNHSDVSQWKYVKTSKNPSGFASRGLEVSSYGKSFYGKTKSCAQMQTLTWRQIEMIQNCFLTKHEVHTVCQLTEMTSDWCKMRRVMALIILFIKKTQERCIKKADINL